MPKNQKLSLGIKGLYTNPNQFSEIPEGSLSVANNCVIDKGGVIESRRGLTRYGNQLTLGVGEYINSIHEYKQSMIVSYASKLAYDSDGLGTWIDYSGVYNPVSGYKIKSIQQNGNFYFTTSTGIKKLQTLTGTIGNSGITKALDGIGTTTGAIGWLTNLYQVAYRCIWGIKDENNNLLLGSPSGRLIVSNASGGTRNTSLTFYIPSGITTSYFYQIYRSPQALTSSTIPNDELQLVYEASPTSTDITNGYFTITDITPEDLKGAYLYTSSTQEGILQSNDQPPVASSIAMYKQMVFLGNTTGKYNYTITLISASTLAVNDTITIGGVVYTGKAAETISSGQFKIFASGISSAYDIEQTAMSLVRVINAYASNTQLYAYYVSGYNDLPGKIYIEERNVGGSAFYITSTKGAAFNPVLPTSGNTIVSSRVVGQNRVYYSKYSQPEAFPALNYFDIGSSDYAIISLISLRDAVFVFKNDGVFRILGDDPTSLRVSIFDNTSQILANNSIVNIANTVYAYTDQGVTQISDNGVQIMGRPIEDILLKTQTYTNFNTSSFSISYESDRRFIFFTKTVAGDLYPTNAYCYNIFTNSWTRWEINATTGYVLNDVLYLADPDGYIRKERKDYSLTDYQDNEYTITITSSSGTQVNYTGSITPIVGMLLKQGTLESYVESIGSGYVVVEDDLSWSAASATLYEPIECEIEWSQQSCGNSGLLKHFRETTIIMRDSSFDSIDVGYSTNLDLIPEYTTINSELEGGWGSFPWGSLPWGGGTSNKPVPIRTYIPLEKSRGSWIYIRVRSTKTKQNFAICGVSLIYSTMSERFV